MPLFGNRVLVIGGSSGIGFALARAALDEGADIVVASSGSDRRDAANWRLGGSTGASFRAADGQAASAFSERSGGFDHIGLAGTNLIAARHLSTVGFSRAVAVVEPDARHVLSRGSIALTKGMAAYRTQKGLPIVAMSGAVATFAAGFAVELAPMCVKGVWPSALLTGAWEGVPSAFHMVQGQRLSGQPLPPAKGKANPHPMKGAYTTRQALPIDGDWSLAS